MANILKNTSAFVNLSKTILLGEDDIDDQELLEDAIYEIDNSFKIQFFTNGNSIIDHLEGLADNSLPCLILLDYNMPQLSGAEILRILKNNSRYNAIPKVIWSTSSSPAYKATCLELGACDYVVKPSNLSALTEVTKHILSYCNNFKKL